MLRRTTAFTALTALTALTACRADPPAPRTPVIRDRLDVQPIAFRTDDGRTVPAELGRLRVPERHATAGGRTIELAFVRFRAETAAPGPPIVYLAGGPGGTGTGAARGARHAFLMALRQVADVIALDQRGTGLSQQLPPCRDRWSVPLDVPATRDQIEAEVQRHARVCAVQWRSEGVDLDAYNTEDSADDIDDLRRALGAPRIALLGASYGTHLGLAVIRRHPDVIDRAVLAGVEGPDATLKLPSDQEALLRRIATLVEADPRTARAYPDLLVALGGVLARLDREPAQIVLDGGVRAAISRFDVAAVVAGALHDPSTIRLLPRSVYEMQRGDFSSMKPWLPDLRSGTIEAMPSAMDAASGASPERLARIRRERGETLLGDVINAPYDAIWAGLGVADLGAAFRAPVQSDVPVVLISGTFDGRTPPHNAGDVRRGLRRAAHVILDGVGHGDGLLIATPEVARLAIAFLRGAPVADRTIAVRMPEIALPRDAGDRR
jgi:pimeloyl-ACP methyl ester carboxylesterase